MGLRNWKCLWVGLGWGCVAIPLPIKCYHLHDKASSEDYVRFL